PILCFFHSQGGTSTTIKNYLKIFSAWRGFKQSWGNSSNRSQQLKICDCSICCERSDTRCSNVSVSYLYTAAIAPGSGATQVRACREALGSRKFRHRVFRKLGGRGQLQTQLQSTRQLP